MKQNNSIIELLILLLSYFNVYLKCYYDQIFDYHFFSLDWQFSTSSTWCARYSFIRLRKVVFFGAQKPLIFVRH